MVVCVVLATMLVLGDRPAQQAVTRRAVGVTSVFASATAGSCHVHTVSVKKQEAYVLHFLRESGHVLQVHAVQCTVGCSDM